MTHSFVRFQTSTSGEFHSNPCLGISSTLVQVQFGYHCMQVVYTCTRKGDVLCSLLQSLPEFGPYLKEKEERIAGYKASIQPVAEFSPAIHRPPITPSSSIPSVQVTCLPIHLCSIRHCYRNTALINPLFLVYRTWWGERWVVLVSTKSWTTRSRQWLSSTKTCASTVASVTWSAMTPDTRWAWSY